MTVIAAVAERVFGDPEAARQWLHSPNPALDDATPIAMLATPHGAETVAAVLGRIEHGVYE